MLIAARKQSGFVVISVLLITTVSTILASSAILENRLQERISGNQNKQLNARALAQQGIFDALNYIKLQQSAGLTASEIKALLSQNSVTGQYTVSAEMGSSTDSLLVTSEGIYQDAGAYLQAEVLVEPGYISTFPGGIVACESLSLAGSALVDSFDSRGGSYGDYDFNNELNIHNNANVYTIAGDLEVSGGSEIKGDVTVNGDVSTSNTSSQITGDLSASGNIDLINMTVTGAISAGSTSSNMGYGYVSLTGGGVSGDVSSVDKIVIPKDGATVGGNIIANDGYIMPSSWSDLSKLGASGVFYSGAKAPSMVNDSCNQLVIENAFPIIESTSPSSFLNDNPSGQVSVTIDSSQASGFENEKTLEPVANLASSLWEDTRSVYFFDNMNLSNTMITITGDITILVEGDVTTSNGASGFQFVENDKTSSLTLLVKGQIDLDSSSQVFKDVSIDNDSEVPLIIYSSNSSSASDNYAVSLLGDSDMYAQVYAPLGDVNYGASGVLTGSLTGKNITLSGTGAIHYDEAIADKKLTQNTDPMPVKILSMYDYYPQ